MIRRIALLLATLATTACAAVTNGVMQRVVVASEPPGAEATMIQCGLFATKRATTPSIVWVNRRATRCRVRFTAPESWPATVWLPRSLSPEMRRYTRLIGWPCDRPGECWGVDTAVAMAVFYAPFVLPSLAIDALTGAMWELEEPRPVTLKPRL